MSRSRSAGLRITKVGLSFLVFAFIALLAASNTGNNGLFLALAVMGSIFLVSQVLAAGNVRQLAFSLGSPTEFFAGSPAQLDLTLENRSRFFARWLLVVNTTPEENAAKSSRPVSATSRPLLVPHLLPRHRHQGLVEIHPSQRGRHTIKNIQVSSLFPLGFFHKAVSHPVDLEFLVFPKTLPAGQIWPTQVGRDGDAPTPSTGRGHDLLGLRNFRHGDDPRGIHWKHSARTGQLVYKEHQAEESQRLLILFDNATGPLEQESAARQRFERLVSEATTAALDHLGLGFDVSLVTRDTVLPFAGGTRQRLRILEALALIEPLPQAATPLAQSSEDSAPCLRLTMTQA